MELLCASQVCGVSWGRTLRSLIEPLATLHKVPPRKRNPVQFVPICGGGLGSIAAKSCASTLAADLAEILNGDTSFSLSLASLPAQIPLDFSRPEVATIRKLLSREIAYQEIFLGGDEPEEQEPPFIERLDTVLTGLSPTPMEDPPRYTKYAHGPQGGVHQEHFSDLIISAISGILIPRPRLDAKGREEVEQMQANWTGIQAKALLRCAENAAQTGAPGVIVVAFGKAKADMVYACVKRGFINHLLIDQDLSEELERLTHGSNEANVQKGA